MRLLWLLKRRLDYFKKDYFLLIDVVCLAFVTVYGGMVLKPFVNLLNFSRRQSSEIIVITIIRLSLYTISYKSIKMEIVVSGIRPTGNLHLGNYFGAVKNFLRLQDEYKCFFFIADWHSLTTHPHPGEIPTKSTEAPKSEFDVDFDQIWYKKNL